ncbi:metalloregulator ArsR/SmtB family transcription factor [Oscillospiraceae bacterium MB08-C2-2]|nr:metalloregulator ArsR/SmtB family transcription factor [Oscillospiraceae bacterium MB08-C2-2]
MPQEKEIITCGECLVHKNLLEKAIEMMPDDEKLFNLAEIFKVFGDSTRIRIMTSLLSGEMCVCDISELLGMNQSAISHQLRLLKNHRLVRSRREGKSVFYALDDSHIFSILLEGLKHVAE